MLKETRTAIAGMATLCLLGACSDGGRASNMSAQTSNPEPAAVETSRRAAKPEKLLVYVGTYTGRDSKGIYAFPLDLATGKAGEARLVAETTSPSFLAIHPSERFLYAANEIANYQGTKAGSVSAFSIDPATGDLAPLNTESSVGGGPCHITVDRSGKAVLLANYGGGSVAVLPIGADGKLGKASAFVQHEGSSVNKRRQEAPHAHSINVSPDNRYAFAADLGLDKVLIYRFDADKGTLTPGSPAAGTVAPGSGPRHFAFHPSGKFAFVINEMTSTLTAFKYDRKNGALEDIHTVPTIPNPVPGNSTAEVVVHPSGKWVYGSNRGHNSIAIFAVDEKTGRLTPKGHQPTGGKTPRNFAVDPTGAYLLAANQDSGTVHIFRVDPKTGDLSPTGQSVDVPMPVCVRFLPISR